MAYSKEGLKEGIKNCKRNIEVLESAIKKERATMEDYQYMIDGLNKAEKDMENAKKSINVELVKDESGGPNHYKSAKLIKEEKESTEG